MRILLDTHVLLWALGERRRLDRPTLTAIESEANEVFFSAASIWEIAIKSALGKADFGVQPKEIAATARGAGLHELPVHSGAASRVAELPMLHRDPFDRLLIAQAIEEPAILYTADDLLTRYSELVQRVGAR
jgi:PIN domain nuclease of toxin-antitoxin system